MRPPPRLPCSAQGRRADSPPSPLTRRHPLPPLRGGPDRLLAAPTGGPRLQRGRDRSVRPGPPPLPASVPEWLTPRAHHLPVAGLMFLALFLGGAAAVAVYIGFFNPRFVKKHHAVVEAGGTMVAPEVVRSPSSKGAATDAVPALTLTSARWLPRAAPRDGPRRSRHLPQSVPCALPLSSVTPPDPFPRLKQSPSSGSVGPPLRPSRSSRPCSHSACSASRSSSFSSPSSTTSSVSALSLPSSRFQVLNPPMLIGSSAVQTSTCSRPPRLSQATLSAGRPSVPASQCASLPPSRPTAGSV